MYVNNKDVPIRKILVVVAFVVLILTIGAYLLVKRDKATLVLNISGGNDGSKVKVVLQSLRDQKDQKLTVDKNKDIEIKTKLNGAITVTADDGDRIEIVQAFVDEKKDTRVKIALRARREGLKLAQNNGDFGCSLKTKTLIKGYNCYAGENIAEYEEKSGEFSNTTRAYIGELERLVARSNYLDGMLFFVSTEQGVSKQSALRYWNTVSGKTTNIPLNDSAYAKLTENGQSNEYINGMRLITGPDASFALVFGDSIYSYKDIDTRPEEISFSSSTEDGRIALASIGINYSVAYFGRSGPLADEEGVEEFDNNLYIKNRNNSDVLKQISPLPNPLDFGFVGKYLYITNDIHTVIYDIDNNKLKPVLRLPPLLSTEVSGEALYGISNSKLYKYNAGSNSALLVFNSDFRLSGISPSGGDIYFSAFLGNGADQEMYVLKLLDSPAPKVPITKILALKRVVNGADARTFIQKRTISTTISLRSLRYKDGEIDYDKDEYNEEKQSFLKELKNKGVETDRYEYDFNLVTRF